MTEYWKSQPRKFCDACKCWLGANKSSVEFHENGKKHQQNVQLRLKEITRKGAQDDIKAKRESDWLKKMEQDAMRAYRDKDLGDGADLTAKIFNEKRAERLAGEAEAKRRAQEEEKASIAEHIRNHQSGSSHQDQDSVENALKDEPQQPGQGTESSDPQSNEETEVPKVPNFSGSGLRKMEAPKSGTKWHKKPASETGPPKPWFEARSGEGHTFYWHVETQESRWDPPPEGYLSIAEQEAIKQSRETQEVKKAEQIAKSQEIHGRDQTPTFAPSQGPEAKPDPYGYWQTVEAKKRKPDYQAPEAKEPIKASVTLHSDRQTKFEERETPSLGGLAAFKPDLDAGIVKKPEGSAKPQEVTVSKPAIVFRKRKIIDQTNLKSVPKSDD